MTIPWNTQASQICLMWGGGHSAERKGKENGEYNQNTLYKLLKEPTETKSLGSCRHVRINVSSSFIYPQNPRRPESHWQTKNKQSVVHFTVAYSTQVAHSQHSWTINPSVRWETLYQNTHTEDPNRVTLWERGTHTKRNHISGFQELGNVS